MTAIVCYHNHMKYLRRIEIYLFLGLLSLPSLALGQRSSGGKIENPLGNDDLLGFVDTIIDAALKIGAVVAVLAVIFAGFKFVTAQGDEEAISTAKKTLLYAAIGIVILLGARAISTVIINTVQGVEDATN